MLFWTLTPSLSPYAASFTLIPPRRCPSSSITSAPRKRINILSAYKKGKHFRTSLLNESSSLLIVRAEESPSKSRGKSTAFPARMEQLSRILNRLVRDVAALAIFSGWFSGRTTSHTIFTPSPKKLQSERTAKCLHPYTLPLQPSSPLTVLTVYR